MSFESGVVDASTQNPKLKTAICRDIIEAHGGRIWAENHLGGGAVFRFTLPLDSAPPSVVPEASAGAKGDKGELAMKRPQRPAYWQLDVFMCVMIALLVLIMGVHTSTRWKILVDAGWAALTLLGMSMWVWANWSAIREEERE
jgi:hypothetical protein